MEIRKFIDGGKYQILEVLRADAEYDTLLCRDITQKSNRKYRVHRIKSTRLVRELLPVFYGLAPERYGFVGTEVFKGGFSAIFRHSEGIPFSDFLTSEKKLPFDRAVRIADNILSEALASDLTDDRLAAGLLAPSCLTVEPSLLTVKFHFSPDPASAEKNFRSRRLGEILRRVFPADRSLPWEIGEFTERLRSGEYSGCAEAYSTWLRLLRSPAIAAVP